MKFISWNVNGLRNCTNNGEFLKFFNKEKADFFCLQEIKSNETQIAFKSKDYKQIWNYSSKKGYSGTVIFTKIEPLNIKYGFEDEYGENFDNENRVITLEYTDFFLVNVYFPNTKNSKKRFNFRLEFDEYFNNHIANLNKIKNVIICGDFNIAHKNIDICKDYRIKTDDKNFFSEEKNDFEELLNIGLIDSFRYFHPQQQKFTWWFHNDSDKINNIGWRLDYFLISKELRKNIRKAEILNNINGSDHCPIELDLQLEV